MNESNKKEIAELKKRQKRENLKLAGITALYLFLTVMLWFIKINVSQDMDGMILMIFLAVSYVICKAYRHVNGNKTEIFRQLLDKDEETQRKYNII